jgi:iron complex outermembrane receptor protein
MHPLRTPVSRTTASLVLAFAPLVPRIHGQTVTPAAIKEAAADAAIELSPFEVRSNRDTGYSATNTISGTKLNTPIKDIPIAIQVVTEDLIRDLQAVTIEDATRYATGVSQPIGNSEFGAADGRFNLRGFSFASPKRNGFSTPGTIDMTNVSRIEILKGPASVLYGEATAGGIVNYITKGPRAKAESSIQLQAGSYEFYRAQIESTGPIGSLLGGQLLYRLDASYFDRSSNINDFDQRQAFVSPLLQWKPFQGTQVTLQYEFLDRDGQVRSKVPIYNTVAKAFWDALPTTDARKTSGNYNQVPRINPDGSITTAGRPYWNAMAGYVDWTINNAGTENYSDARSETIDVTVEHRFSPSVTGRVAANVYNVNIDSQSGNQNRMRAGGDGPERFASRHYRGNYRRTIQADLAGTHNFGELSNRFLVNYEYFKEDNWRITYSRDGNATSPTLSDAPRFYYFPSPYNTATIRVNQQTIPLPIGYLGFVPVPLISINTRQSIEMNAFSANDTISFFNNRLSILGGIRYQTSSQVLRNLDLYNTVTGVRTGTGSVQTPADVKRTTPMAGVSFQVNSWMNVYTLWSQSFVPQFGTAKNESGSDFALKPVVGESKELGLKVADSNGRFSATAAVFDISNKNRSRFGGLIATGPLTGQSYTIQTDAEGAKGFELDGIVSPMQGWQILVGYAYTDSKIKDPLFAEPVSLIDPNSPRDVRIPGVPRHQINLLQKYTFTKGALKGFAVNFGANYQGERRGSESAQEVITIPAVWLYDAGISYAAKIFDRRTDLRLTVSNVFDKKYVTTGPFLGDPLTFRFAIRTQF